MQQTMKHKIPAVKQNQYSGHRYLVLLINYFCSDQCYLFMSKATQNGRGKSMQTPGGFKMFSIISSTGCFHGNLRPELSVDLHPTRSYSKALISSHNVLCTSHVYFSPHTYIDIIQINISHSMVFESTLMLFWIRDQIIFLWLFITLSFPIQRLWRWPRCTSDSPDHFNYLSC